MEKEYVEEGSKITEALYERICCGVFHLSFFHLKIDDFYLDVEMYELVKSFLE